MEGEGLFKQKASWILSKISHSLIISTKQRKWTNKIFSFLEILNLNFKLFPIGNNFQCSLGAVVFFDLLPLFQEAITTKTKAKDVNYKQNPPSEQPFIKLPKQNML